VVGGERERRARSFGGVAHLYERARPEYPREAAAWLVAGAHEVLDLGAGTGKLTRVLVALGLDVVAVEPSERMGALLRDAVPGVRVAAGSAEEIPLPDASVDAVVAGQAFHWFEPARALPEIARVLRPGGRLGLVWNVRDVSVPWVARLSELLGAEEWTETPEATLAQGGLFGPVETMEFRHEQPLGRQALVDLVASRSSIVTSTEAERSEVLARVERLFDETAAGAAELVLPYVTRCFRATRP
jgi:SAM-dependent methyltransferase